MMIEIMERTDKDFLLKLLQFRTPITVSCLMLPSTESLSWFDSINRFYRNQIGRMHTCETCPAISSTIFAQNTFNDLFCSVLFWKILL